MARNKLNHPHGDDGTKPPDNLNFQAGDKPDPEHFDWFWATVTSVVDGHTSEFTRLDSDNDGQVDAADTADDATNVTSTYKGNDLDTDGDGQVNAADTADTATDATNVTSTYKGNDIDADGDGKVNAAEQADNADTVDGSNVIVQSTQPSSPDDGDIWIDTS